MYRKVIKCNDFDGNPIEEEHYFNLTRTELTKMRFSEKGGFENYIKEIVNANDEPQMIKIFDQIVTASYGKRTPDGRGFKKSPEILEEFTSSAAYDALFMELVTNAKAMSDFVNGIIPADMRDAANGVLPATGPVAVK